MKPRSWRQVALFYLLTLGFSWAWWLWLIASGAGWSHLPGLMGPMFAALVVAGLAEGRPGVAGMLRRMVRLPRNPLRALALALSPVAALIAVFAALRLAGHPRPETAALFAYSGVPAGWPPVAIVLVTLVVNGFGEEAGWRGFLFDRLEPGLGPFRATLVVIPLWLAWHIPAFWVAPGLAAMAGWTILGWAVGLAFGAFVLSHVYLLGGRSILVVAVWHTGFNFGTATAATEGTVAAVLSTAVMVWGATVALIWARRPAKPSISP